MRNVGIIILTVALLAVLLLGGYAVWQTQSTRDQLETTYADNVVIYLVRATPTDFLLVPVDRQLDGPASPLAALETLIAGPLPEEDLVSSVPPDAQVLGLNVDEGLATVNFSKELQTGYVGGSQTEANLIYAIVNTLTEFAEIERVQILLEGEIVESIGGHMVVDKPLERQG